MDERVAITRIPLGMTSAYVVRGPVPILIDAGMAGQEAVLRFRLRRAGVEVADLALIVVTHAHSDHAGCLAWLRTLTDAAIAASPDTMTALRAGASACMRPRTVLARAMVPLLASLAKYPAVCGDVAVQEPLPLAPYGIDGHVIPTPGHTRGCLSVVIGRNAIVGDLVSGRMGRPRAPAIPRLLEDRAAWEKSVRSVLARGVERLYPAHGGPFKADQVVHLL